MNPVFVYLAAHPRLPASSSGRLILAGWSLFSVSMMATYSGNLVAFLTVDREVIPFSSIAELVSQTVYKWGFLGDGVLRTIFMVHVHNMDVWR